MPEGSKPQYPTLIRGAERVVVAQGSKIILSHYHRTGIVIGDFDDKYITVNDTIGIDRDTLIDWCRP